MRVIVGVSIQGWPRASPLYPPVERAACACGLANRVHPLCLLHFYALCAVLCAVCVLLQPGFVECVCYLRVSRSVRARVRSYYPFFPSLSSLSPVRHTLPFFLHVLSVLLSLSACACACIRPCQHLAPGARPLHLCACVQPL